MAASKTGQLKKVGIHGVPRSGTSWLGEIFNSCPTTLYRYQPLFSYAHKDFLGSDSSERDIDSFFARLSQCRDDFTNQSDRRESGEFPVFSKRGLTHVVYKEVRYHNILLNLIHRSDDVQLCTIVRNPLSVINSWLRAPREFRRDLGWSELQEWRSADKKNQGRPEEFNGYEKWKQATNIFLGLQRDYPGRVYLQKYSRLIESPLAETAAMFEFFGLEFTDTTAGFLQKSVNTGNRATYSVFRSQPDDNAWREQLDPGIARQIIDDLRGTDLEEFLDGNNG